MSNTLGHNILQQSLLRPPLLEPQRKLNSSGIPANTLFQAVCGNQSAAHSRKSPLSRKFFGNNLSVQKSKLASGTRCPVTVVPLAVLAMDPASEVIIHLLKMVAYPFCFKMLNVQEDLVCKFACLEVDFDRVWYLIHQNNIVKNQ